MPQKSLNDGFVHFLCQQFAACPKFTPKHLTIERTDMSALTSNGLQELFASCGRYLHTVQVKSSTRVLLNFDREHIYGAAFLDPVSQRGTAGFSYGCAYFPTESWKAAADQPRKHWVRQDVRQAFAAGWRRFSAVAVGCRPISHSGA